MPAAASRRSSTRIFSPRLYHAPADVCGAQRIDPPPTAQCFRIQLRSRHGRRSATGPALVRAKVALARRCSVPPARAPPRPLATDGANSRAGSARASRRGELARFRPCDARSADPGGVPVWSPRAGWRRHADRLTDSSAAARVPGRFGSWTDGDFAPAIAWTDCGPSPKRQIQSTRRRFITPNCVRSPVWPAEAVFLLRRRPPDLAALPERADAMLCARDGVTGGADGALSLATFRHPS